MAELFYESVTPTLREILGDLMEAREFSDFRLVGGTALSLQRGHRKSADIDLFTDASYGSIDFGVIDRFLKSKYAYVDTSDYKEIGMGTSYFAGASEEDSVKLDLFYTENFIRPVREVDGIRMAGIEDIIAMKLDVISRTGRKKDFWDVHELMSEFTFEQMLAMHLERYPHGHDGGKIAAGFQNFNEADEDFDPVCLRGKHWEVIKLDLLDFVPERNRQEGRESNPGHNV